MAIIIRIDVDRPYGRSPLTRHILSRISSDFWLPKVSSFGFLVELRAMLEWLNDEGARSYVFFRRCTLPCTATMELLEKGNHKIGLHLENSRTFETFLAEKQILEQHVGREIDCMSKHGSGGAKYGLHHYAPYEPERYIEWGDKCSMHLFLGNQQDPTVNPVKSPGGMLVVPSAFWLEPFWRDTNRFSVDWLLHEACTRDIVLLVHPENVIAEPSLTSDFKMIIKSLQSRIV